MKSLRWRLVSERIDWVRDLSVSSCHLSAYLFLPLLDFIFQALFLHVVGRIAMAIKYCQLQKSSKESNNKRDGLVCFLNYEGIHIVICGVLEYDTSAIRPPFETEAETNTEDLILQVTGQILSQKIWDSDFFQCYDWFPLI